MEKAMPEIAKNTGDWIDIAYGIRATLRQDGVSSNAVDRAMEQMVAIGQKAYDAGVQAGMRIQLGGKK
jgi:hypothetical protein